MRPTGWLVSLVLGVVTSASAGCDCGGGADDDDGRPATDAGAPDGSLDAGEPIADAAADAQSDGGGTLDAAVDAAPDDGGGTGDDAGGTGDDAGARDAGVSDDAGVQADAGPDAAVELDCTSCHGEGDQPAPPVDTAGNRDSTLPTVGAHRRHLRSSIVFRTGQCTDCHVVPESIDAPGHIDDAPAELVWGAVPTADGVLAEYAADSCSVYCHGETLSGGEVTRPDWTPAGHGEVYCGSCHGVPPPLPHVQVRSCSNCHPFNGFMPLDPERHVDGVLDVNVECTSCHGGADGPAPPLDTHGNDATTERGVGAHASHLGTSDWRATIVCTDCHTVPVDLNDPAHLDGDGVAELTWGALAGADQAAPAWDGANCSGVYCHGETLSAGTETTPTWTVVDGSQAACGTCHGLPPTENHPQSADCSVCHGAVIDAARNIIAPERHIDGVVDVALDCNSCHGGENGPAPPTDTHGNDATSERGVGAHQSHLGASNWRASIACTDCHDVPANVDDAGHLDGDGTAELEWSALARTDGADPAWDGVSCAGVYCHGGTLSGGTDDTPTWTIVDGTQDACGTCHGLPPGNGHPDRDDCSTCHAAVIDLNGTIIAPNLHVNGTVDVQLDCTSCHGGAAGPAPPVDTHGNDLTSATGVGAHQSHLGESGWHATVVCTDCHLVPGAVDDAGHLDGDGVAELAWGALARVDLADPLWNGASCSGVYCHGETLSGGTETTPSWTVVDGTQDACGTCHGLPPTQDHPNAPRCADCHGMVVDAARNFVAPDRHIDGVVDVDPNAACGACHDIPPATGTHALHAGLAAPVYGAVTAGTDLGVTNGYAFGCGLCHPIDPARHMNGGRAEIELYDPNAPAGSLKARNPVTATYVAGGAVLTDSFGLDYTLGTCSDVFCHSGLQTTSSDVDEPGVDFPFVGYPIVYPPYTVTRTRAYRSATWGGALSCAGCHGYPPRGDWPADIAGAGESHATLTAEGWEDLHVWNHGYDPVPCRTCHYDTVTGVAPFARDANGLTALTDMAIARYDRHVDGAAQVRFDTVDAFSYSQPVDLGPATWDSATRTCTNVACHQYQTSVVFGTPYRSTNTVECDACHQF